MIIKNPNFRPGTETEPKDVLFSMMMEGEETAALGDMIAWMSSIIYVAENYDYVRGHLIVPSFFVPIAFNLMERFPHWHVYNSIPDRFANGVQIKQPMPHPINATGMHLVDLGFLYFVGIVPPPEGAAVYPELDLNNVPLLEELQGKRYVVMTPCATTPTRQMLPSDFNKISDGLIARNILPVYLGKTDMKKRNVELHEGYDLSKGLNLIGQTSLLHAAKIMWGAGAVIGIDNGLLHLAAMTDVPIVYGYTMTGPEQRRINRKHGHTVELHADKEKLKCLFCQERIRFFIGHNFTNCIYKENEPACVKALNAESWLANIDGILNEH